MEFSDRRSPKASLFLALPAQKRERKKICSRGWSGSISMSDYRWEFKMIDIPLLQTTACSLPVPESVSNRCQIILFNGGKQRSDQMNVQPTAAMEKLQSQQFLIDFREVSSCKEPCLKILLLVFGNKTTIIVFLLK